MPGYPEVSTFTLVTRLVIIAVYLGLYKIFDHSKAVLHKSIIL